MKKYQKIDNVFKFDEKYRKILGLNEPFDTFKNIQWEGTEKVDGTNIRIHWNGYEIDFAGRTDKSIIPQHLLEYLIKTFKTKEMEYVFEQMFGEKEVYLFGEGCGPKIQADGQKYFDEPTFVLFDVNVDGYDLTRKNVNLIAIQLGLNAVPVLFHGTLEEAINWVSTPSLSFVGKCEHEIEGLVLVPANDLQLYDKHGKMLKCKLKYEDVKRLKGDNYENN